MTIRFVWEWTMSTSTRSIIINMKVNTRLYCSVSVLYNIYRKNKYQNVERLIKVYFGTVSQWLSELYVFMSISVFRGLKKYRLKDISFLSWQKRLLCLQNELSVLNYYGTERPDFKLYEFLEKKKTTCFFLKLSRCR